MISVQSVSTKANSSSASITETYSFRIGEPFACRVPPPTWTLQALTCKNHARVAAARALREDWASIADQTESEECRQARAELKKAIFRIGLVFLPDDMVAILVSYVNGAQHLALFHKTGGPVMLVEDFEGADDIKARVSAFLS